MVYCKLYIKLEVPSASDILASNHHNSDLRYAAVEDPSEADTHTKQRLIRQCTSGNHREECHRIVCGSLCVHGACDARVSILEVQTSKLDDIPMKLSKINFLTIPF